MANNSGLQSHLTLPSADDIAVINFTHREAISRLFDLALNLDSDHGLSTSLAQQWLQQMETLPLTTEYSCWEGCCILAASDYRAPLSPSHIEQLRTHKGSRQAVLDELQVLVNEQALLAETDGAPR